MIDHKRRAPPARFRGAGSDTAVNGGGGLTVQERLDRLEAWAADGYELWHEGNAGEREAAVARWLRKIRAAISRGTRYV